MKLILIFIAVPLLELFLLLKLAEWTSGTFTFALVILTGVVGGTFARRQGWGVVQRLQYELRAGEFPRDVLIEGLLIFVAGLLLITPGIITDLVGFMILIPPLRRGVRRGIVHWIRKNLTVVSMNAPHPDRWTEDTEAIDARVVSRDDGNERGA
jgi:UPF0716 protein FxsA